MQVQVTAVQRRCRSMYLLALLLVSFWHGHDLRVGAQGFTSSPSPSPTGPATGAAAVSPSTTPSPSPAAAASPSPSHSLTPSPLPTVTPPLQPPPSGPAGAAAGSSLPAAAIPAAGTASGSSLPAPATPAVGTAAGGSVPGAATPATGGPTLRGSRASGGGVTNRAPGDTTTPITPPSTVPTPPATGSTGVTVLPSGSTVPPVTGSAAGGVPSTSPIGTTQPVGSIPPVGGPVGSNTIGTATNVTMPGYVLPTPDDTAIKGLSPSDDGCKLMSALYNAMGASSSACTNSSSKASSSARSGMRRLREYTRSSEAFHDGLYTAKGGQSFCVSREGAARIAQQSGSRTQLASAADIRELPDIYDPACDDVYAASTHREGCPSGRRAGVAGVRRNVLQSGAANDNNDPGAPPGPDVDLQNCSQKFTKVGCQPRSLAIVLLKWRREYYYSKDECCRQQNYMEGCDCFWAGRTYDNLLPLHAYTRVFTDECDKGPSLNRAYYDLSGGRITFHSKLRVPVPSSHSASPSPEPPIIEQDQPAGNGPSSSLPPRSSTAMPAPDPPQPPAGPSPSTSPYTVPTDPVSTPTSYLDPNGVDVYGYATLDGMRNANGGCRDWCTEAITQLGVDPSKYDHLVCLQLLGNSKALCDVCEGGACINTCPADTGITTGCGCATCYYTWGMQSGCTAPPAPGARAGLSYWQTYYQGEMAQLAGGQFASVDASIKLFLGHEVGHNVGLTHTGAINCKIAGDGTTVMRAPQFCKPDWYGDRTSFMGKGATLQLPAAIKYKLNWLPSGTLKLHTPGTERRWVLRPTTVRRPSWQPSTSVSWFDEKEDDTLAVRIPLRNPPGAATTSSYSCPCSPVGADGNPGGVCPACRDGAGGDPCANGPCCLELKCADSGLTWYYVELHMPYRNDYASTYKGLAIRMVGESASTNCTSTRQVPTHVQDGQLQYLLNEPDPSGETPGSTFVDPVRGVKVVFEQWSNNLYGKRGTSAVVYITA